MGIQMTATDVTTTDGTEQLITSTAAGPIVTRLALDISDGAGATLVVRFTQNMDMITGGIIVPYVAELDVDALAATGQTGWQTDDIATNFGGNWSIERTAGPDFDCQWEAYTT